MLEKKKRMTLVYADPGKEEIPDMRLGKVLIALYAGHISLPVSH